MNTKIINCDYVSIHGMSVYIPYVYGIEFALWSTKLSYNDAQSPLPDFLAEQNARKFVVSEENRRLLRKLVRAGPSHSKFMRFITAYLVICAPRYWWSQFDTYKIGVSTLSQSTMHTLTKRKLSMFDFVPNVPVNMIEMVNGEIDKKSLESAKAILPEGFLQTRGVCTNYQTLRTMYHQRLHHKLTEWKLFCRAMEIMPESYLITDA